MTKSILQAVEIVFTRGTEKKVHRDLGIVFGQFAAVKRDNGDNWGITHAPTGSKISLMGVADTTNGFVTWFQAIRIAEALHEAFPEPFPSYEEMAKMPDCEQATLSKRVGLIISLADRDARNLVESTDYLK